MNFILLQTLESIYMYFYFEFDMRFFNNIVFNSTAAYLIKFVNHIITP